jgi:cellulose synthase/poly-beta-1,6-N-acetylglucosamine synthase-like glycosyltransferase
MSVAVVMSTFNEERYVDRALQAIAGQTVGCETIVVDGGSNDATVPRLRAWAERWPRLRVVADGHRRSLPEALNVAMAMTQQPLVAKVDARTFVAPDFIASALEVFARERDDVACVGGQPQQRGETTFGEALACARTSRFGVGASGYADARERVDVDSVQCGIYRRAAVLDAGGFDPALQFGEDEELNWRLRRAGWRIVRDRAIRFEYVTRPSWSAAFRQYRNYGRARVDVWRKHRDFLRPHHLVPATALVTGAAIALGAVAWSRLRVPAAFAAGAYVFGALAASVLASRGRARLVPHVARAFVALHLGYGVGLLEGILSNASPYKSE